MDFSEHVKREVMIPGKHLMLQGEKLTTLNILGFHFRVLCPLLMASVKT